MSRPNNPMCFLAPQYACMQGPPGDITDMSFFPRTYAASAFGTNLTETAPLARYIRITTPRLFFALMRVRDWHLTGNCRFNVSDYASRVGAANHPGEFQSVDFECDFISDRREEDPYLFTDYPVRPPENEYEPPYRGFSIEPVTPNPGDLDPRGTAISCTVAGDTGDDEPAPDDHADYVRRYIDVGNISMRFAEYIFPEAYESGDDSWALNGDGFIQFDLSVMGAPWRSILTGVNAPPAIAMQEARVIGNTPAELKIIGHVGSAVTFETGAPQSEVIGTAEGHEYNFILQPTRFWEYEKNGVRLFDGDSGLTLA